MMKYERCYIKDLMTYRVNSISGDNKNQINSVTLHINKKIVRL